MHGASDGERLETGLFFVPYLLRYSYRTGPWGMKVGFSLPAIEGREGSRRGYNMQIQAGQVK
ncbi:MAG: hypothetical protein KUG56_05295 [Kordiimonadaceae bacterium]|nr:hypothetical protein [Kordiimonadaceae bacterium]